MLCPLVILLFMFAFVGVLIASIWKIFEKAGAPGWAALVPFYNLYIMTTVVLDKEPLWFWLHFVPFVNIYCAIVDAFALAEKFGKETAFGFGLLFLGFIFYPMLAFGDAEHESQRRGRRRSRGRSYGDYEDDEDDRPRRKRRYEDDEDADYEDDRPRVRRRRYEDEDEEDDRPRRKRRRDDDDD